MAIYDFQESKPRWFSFENREGAPGMGGQTNLGAKGSPSGSVPAGETLVLCHAQGEGILRRIWMTFANRTPEMLEDVRIRMRWDGAPSYAVDAPLGEFFCQGRWGMRPMENAFFASPEGRSLVCAIPMPFRQEACVELYNGADAPVENLFYDVDLTLEPVEPQAMYFHCQYSQTHGEPAGIDFVWLSASGKGRLLGVCISGLQSEDTRGLWFGEGEVKIYLGEEDFPTLVGTGTEDYIGTAWGQGEFIGRYTGSLYMQEGCASFYRFHVPDPIYFDHGIRAVIQRIGGGDKALVLRALTAGAGIIPVTSSTQMRLLEDGLGLDAVPEGDWVNYYSWDAFTAAAYYYSQTP